MKRSLLLLVAVFFLNAGFAQFQHTPLLYCNFGYGSFSSPSFAGISHQTTGYILNPGLGYQFSRHFTLGAMASLSNGVNAVRGQHIRTEETVAGPFLRYSHFFGYHIYVFAQFGMNYVSGSARPEDEAGNKMPGAAYYGIRPDLHPGIGIHFGKGISLNLGAGGIQYNSLNQEQTELHVQEFRSTFGKEYHAGLSFNLGVGLKALRFKGTREPMDETRFLDTREEEEAGEE